MPVRAPGPARPSIEALIAAIEAHIDAVEGQRSAHVARHHAALSASLATTSGIGTTTALIAGQPELGKLSRQHISALVGVAPLDRDLGKKRGRRCILGGRPDVRISRSMATLAATRFTAPIRRFCLRLGQIRKTPGRVPSWHLTRNTVALWSNRLFSDQCGWSLLMQTTGTFAKCNTLRAIEPSTMPEIAPSPRVPMTMWSQPSSSANATRVSAGSPSLTWVW